MAHYVIISSDYIKLPSTNGICDSVIANELARRGNVVDVICYGNNRVYSYKKQKNLTLHTIRACSSLNDGFIKRLISRAIAFLFYPIKHPKFCSKFYEIFKMIYNHDGVDYVLASQMPAETVQTIRKIRKDHPNIKIGIYALDLLSNSLIDLLGWRRILQYKSRLLEKHNFRIADIIFCLQCNKKIVDGCGLKKYAIKFKYVDIPLISFDRYEKMKTYMHTLCRVAREEIIFIYSGTLLKEFREPSYIIELLRALQLDRKCRMDFYSRGAYINELEIETEDIDFIRFRGYIPQEELDERIADADFLVSIGNSHTESFAGVPSKIFTYMSTGKPIVHILGGKFDSCKQYFKFYPDVLLIDPKNRFEENLDIFKEFILRRRNEMIPFELIKNNLRENTPEYSVNIIEKSFQDIEMS